MINNISNTFLFFILLLPFLLITGPALPDITITLSAIFFLFLVIYKKNYENLFKNKIVILSIFFWLYLLSISLIAENRYLSFRDALIFIRILTIPIFFIFWISNKNKQIEKMIMMIFIAVILVSLDTFYQFTQYNGEYGFGKDLFGFKSDWYGRLTGPFGDELIPGAYLSKFTFLGLIFIFLKIKNNNFQNIISIIYLSFIGIIIFVTGERMALATYLMGLLFLTIFFKNKRLIFLISLFITIFLNILINKSHSFYNDFRIIESTPYHLGLKIEKEFQCNNNLNTCKKIIKLQPEFLQVLKNFDKSAYGEIYLLGKKMFNDHKWFGVGLNNFTFLCNNDLRYKHTMKNYNCVSHPHNIYLQWLVETGLIGLSLFIIYIFYISYFIIKKNFNEYSLLGITTILILFWPIMSTGSLLKNWNGVSTFYLIGICLVIHKIKKSN